MLLQVSLKTILLYLVLFPGEGAIPDKKDRMPVVPYRVLESGFGTSRVCRVKKPTVGAFAVPFCLGVWSRKKYEKEVICSFRIGSSEG